MLRINKIFTRRTLEVTKKFSILIITLISTMIFFSAAILEVENDNLKTLIPEMDVLYPDGNREGLHVYVPNEKYEFHEI